MEYKDIKNKKIDPGCLLVLAFVAISFIIGVFMDKRNYYMNGCCSNNHKKEIVKKNHNPTDSVKTQQFLWNQRIIRSK